MVRQSQIGSPFMRRSRVPLPVLAAALSACVVEPELLNSERIESQFGSFGIDVVSYEQGVRRANLYSMANGRPVCRTYAVVRFDNVPEESIGPEHAQIVAGASIGATFKANGWQIFKETRYLGEQTLTPAENTIATLMHVDPPTDVAMHVYRLLLKKESQIIESATIIELHHPEYLGLTRLRELFAVDELAAPGRELLDEWTALLIRDAS